MLLIWKRLYTCLKGKGGRHKQFWTCNFLPFCNPPPPPAINVIYIRKKRTIRAFFFLFHICSRPSYFTRCRGQIHELVRLASSYTVFPEGGVVWKIPYWGRPLKSTWRPRHFSNLTWDMDPMVTCDRKLKDIVTGDRAIS